MPKTFPFGPAEVPLLKVLAMPFYTIQRALKACDDCWTWTTLNGDIYEDVVLLKMDRDNVTIRHKYGMTSLARTELDPRVQQSLVDHSEMADPDDFYRESSDSEPYFKAACPPRADRLGRTASPR
jgi:hypothetical protein